MKSTPTHESASDSPKVPIQSFFPPKMRHDGFVAIKLRENPEIGAIKTWLR